VSSARALRCEHFWHDSVPGTADSGFRPRDRGHAQAGGQADDTLSVRGPPTLCEADANPHLWPAFLAGFRSEAVERAVDARLATEAAGGVSKEIR
jgi:hypothetical protein